MQITWDKQKIADVLASAFVPQSLQRPDDDDPTAMIDILITFDDRGVSSHPNHISLYHGAMQFLASLTNKRPSARLPVDVYSLTTVPITRKYLSFADSIISVAMMALSSQSDATHPASLLFVNGPDDVGRSIQAMTQGHKSQMVWFRYGWIGMSRYMVVNDLKLLEPPRP